MEPVFVRVLNMSLSASVLILVVMLLRMLFARAPKWMRGILWAMVAVRLMVPFSIESDVSLIPSAEPIPNDIALMQTPALETGIPFVNEAVNPVLVHRFTPNPAASVNPLQVVERIASIVWIAGVVGMLAFLLFSYLRAKRSVRAAIPWVEGVYVSDEVPSPFVLGVFRPRIYLPSGLEETTRQCVLLHERAHLLRHDHWWKPLSFLILSIHWFNPLCWLAYVLFCRDIESACDEKVIALMDSDGRAAYSQALLDCSRPRRIVAVCPLAFGETGVRERVRSILQYRQPLLRVVVAALSVSLIVAVCFLTNPRAIRETEAAEIPTPENTETPTQAPTEAARAEPTPWAGNGHWYTFEVLPWGVMSSTNTKYLAVYSPYMVQEANAVVIGRIRGMPTEVKVYTSDPEERFIWSLSEHFYGVFLRDDVKLPNPDLDTDPLALWMEGAEMRLSEEARTELLSLLDVIEGSDQSLPQSNVDTDSMPYITIIFDDIPGLSCWASLTILQYENRLMLTSWKPYQEDGYEADRMVEIDPNGALHRAYDAFMAQASDQEHP